jgi:hypothetical protein
MSERIFTTTGNEIIDNLQRVQVAALMKPNPLDRIEHVRQWAPMLGSTELQQKECQLLTSETFIAPLGSDGLSIKLQRQMLITGSLAVFRYMQDTEVPIDSIIMDIVHPQILDADPEDQAIFDRHILRVPVLAVQAFRAA